MPFYHKVGKIPHKRHTQFRRPDGELYTEELFGTEGFHGNASLLYHHHPPVRVVNIEPGEAEPIEDWNLPVQRHVHLRTKASREGGDPISGRRVLMYNNDCRMGIVRPNEPMSYFYKNGQADELYFVHEGTGRFETMFGTLPYREGDYVLIPHGTIYRIVMDEGKAQRWLTVEGKYIQPPKRYRNEFGQLLEGAPYSERDIRRPLVLNTHDEMGDFRILVKQYDALSEFVLDHHPFDVVGWDGYFYPWIFNIHDFEPIVGRVHQPPPVHQTFQGDGFVVCSFCPRPYDFGENAVPAPYNHSNVDSDEVIYYASDEFMSRKGIEFGSITHHPDGIPHGPHPGRAEASIGAKWTNELAVMMDSFRPLKVAKAAAKIEDPTYHKSWIEAQHARVAPQPTVTD
jgi:homogentisate 1,2-dioxygenase